jgi:hypothetical protein
LANKNSFEIILKIEMSQNNFFKYKIDNSAESSSIDNEFEDFYESYCTNDHQQSDRISLGKTFHSYEHFRDELELYCKETLQLFVITNSVKLKIENGKLANTFDKPYKTQIFKCIMYKKQLDSSQLENAKYIGSSCMSYFRLNLNERGPAKGLYKITAMKNEHNHEITSETYTKYYKNRQLSSNNRVEGEEMIQSYSNINSKSKCFKPKNGSPKPMSQSEKYDSTLKIAHEIANSLKNMNQKEFEAALSQLVLVKELIKNNKSFKIVTIENDNDNNNAINREVKQTNIENGDEEEEEANCNFLSQSSLTPQNDELNTSE